MALALAARQWPAPLASGAGMRPTFLTTPCPVTGIGSKSRLNDSACTQRDLFLLARPMVFARTSASDLDRLPGIGPRMARRIIAFRDQGLINSADDLVRVPGISECKARQLAPLLTWDSPAHATF